MKRITGIFVKTVSARSELVSSTESVVHPDEKLENVKEKFDNFVVENPFSGEEEKVEQLMDIPIEEHVENRIKKPNVIPIQTPVTKQEYTEKQTLEIAVQENNKMKCLLDKYYEKLSAIKFLLFREGMGVL